MRPYKGGLECWLSYTRNGEHWSHRSADESCRIPNFQAVYYLETFTEEALGHKAHRQKICNALLIALMHLLLRELENAPALLPATVPQNDLQLSAVRSLKPMDQAKEYIRGHIGEPLTLKRVARSVYMSERSFVHQFRQATGQSFMEYLTDRRFEEACSLLQDTDWSVEMVSGFVGVKSGRLRALFHQRVGLPPKTYRQENTNADK